MPDRDGQQTMDEAQQDIKRAEVEVLEILERIAYAVIAFFATVIFAKQFLHMHQEAAYEVGMLNGGLAYYSHAATGRVIRALWTVAKYNHAQAKKLRARVVPKKGE